MNRKKKNALFSFHPGLLPRHQQKHRTELIRRASWDRLPKAKRRKVAIAAGVSERIADVWAKIRWHDIPEGWKNALLSNLGAARNPMKKKTKRKKKKAVRRVVRRARTTPKKKKNRSRPRKNKARARRRNHTVSFPFPVTADQRKKLKSFLPRLAKAATVTVG